MAAMDEMVLAVAAAELFQPGRFQGLQTEGIERWLGIAFDARLGRFLPRTSAETDPAWKQIIPYVVLACGGEVFCYRRGGQSTEARLRALHSVGLGGHIRPSDESFFAAPGRAAYDAALQRELSEEVAIEAAVQRTYLAGLINDDSSAVGQVHLGLVHIWELEAPRVRARESKIAAGRWATPAALLGSDVGAGPSAATPRVPLVLAPAWGPAAPSRRCASLGSRRILLTGAARPSEFRGLSRRFCSRSKRRDPLRAGPELESWSRLCLEGWGALTAAAGACR